MRHNAHVVQYYLYKALIAGREGRWGYNFIQQWYEEELRDSKK